MDDPHSSFTDWHVMAASGGPEKFAEILLERTSALSQVSGVQLLASMPDPDTVRSDVCDALEAESPLAHVPFVLQDVFDIAGSKTQCGAPFRDPFEAESDLSCLLLETLRTTGALYAGKVHPSEFALALDGKNQTFGTPPHPHLPDQTIAGSAAACAYAVATGVVPLAFGLDTLGGLRLSAASTGLYSFRLPPNDYASDGVFPIAPTIDSLGWLTACPKDLIACYRTLCKPAEAPPAKSPRSRDALRGLYFDEVAVAVDRQVKYGILDAFSKIVLEDAPAERSMLATPLGEARKALKIISGREIRAIHRYWLSEYREAYEPSIWRMINRADNASSMIIDAAYDTQKQVRRALLDVLEIFDFVVLPVCPIPSPRREDFHPEMSEQIERLLAPVSLAGFPALTVPVQLENGRSAAAQVIYNPSKDYLPIRILEAISPELVDDI